MEKVCQICEPMLVTEHFLILVNSPKQLIHARNYLENKIL